MSSMNVVGPVGRAGITDERIVQCSNAFSGPTFACRGSVYARGHSRPDRPGVAARAEALDPHSSTRKAEAIGGNLGAADIELSIVEMTEIEAGAAQIESPGGRHSDTAEAIINL
jgi:hypothetical protein